MKSKKKGRKAKSRSGDGATSGPIAFPPYKQPCFHHGLPADLGRRFVSKSDHDSEETGAAGSSPFTSMDPEGASNDVSEDEGSLFGSLPRCVPQSSVGLNDVSFGLRNRVWGISHVTEPREGHFGRLFGRGSDQVQPSQFRPLLQPPTSSERPRERSNWGLLAPTYTSSHFEDDTIEGQATPTRAGSRAGEGRRFTVPVGAGTNIDNLVQPYRLPSFGRISSDGFLHVNSANLNSRSCDSSGRESRSSTTDSAEPLELINTVPVPIQATVKRDSQNDNTFFHVYSITHNGNSDINADAASSTSVSDAKATGSITNEAALCSSGAIEADDLDQNRTDCVSISGLSTGFRTNPSQALFGGFLVAPFQWVEKFYCDSDEDSVEEFGNHESYIADDALIFTDDTPNSEATREHASSGEAQGIITDPKEGPDEQDEAAAKEAFPTAFINNMNDDPTMLPDSPLHLGGYASCESPDSDPLEPCSHPSPTAIHNGEVVNGSPRASPLNGRHDRTALHGKNFPYFGEYSVASPLPLSEDASSFEHEIQRTKTEFFQSKNCVNLSTGFDTPLHSESDNDSDDDTSIPAIFRELFDGPLSNDSCDDGFPQTPPRTPCVCGQNCEPHNDCDDEAGPSEAIRSKTSASLGDSFIDDSSNYLEIPISDAPASDFMSSSPNRHGLSGPVNSLRELIRSNPGPSNGAYTNNNQVKYDLENSSNINDAIHPLSKELDDCVTDDAPISNELRVDDLDRSLVGPPSPLDFRSWVQSSRTLPGFISASILGGSQFPGYDDSSVGAASMLGSVTGPDNGRMDVTIQTEASHALEDIQEVNRACPRDIGDCCEAVSDICMGLPPNTVERQMSTTSSPSASAFPSLERTTQPERTRSLENIAIGDRSGSTSNSNSLERARSAEDIGSNFSTLSSMASGVGIGRVLGRHSIHRHEEGPVYRPLPDANQLLRDAETGESGVDAGESWRQNWYFYQYDHRLLPTSNPDSGRVRNPFERRRQVSDSIISPPTYDEVLSETSPVSTNPVPSTDPPDLPCEPPPPYSKAPPPYTEMDQQISASVANSVADSDSVAEGSVHDSDSGADISDNNDVVAYIQRVLAPARGQRANLIRVGFCQPIYLPDMNSAGMSNPLHRNISVGDSDNSGDESPYFSLPTDERGSARTPSNEVETGTRPQSRSPVSPHARTPSADMDVDQETPYLQHQRSSSPQHPNVDFSRPLRPLGFLNTAMFGQRPPLRWNRNHGLDRWDCWPSEVHG